MPTLSEAVRERMVGRDEVDGFHLDMAKVEGYLKQLVLWVRILIKTILVISLVSIAVWIFFAPAHKDVSDRMIDMLIGALNSENLAALVGECGGSRYSVTTTAHVNGPAAA